MQPAMLDLLNMDVMAEYKPSFYLLATVGQLFFVYFWYRCLIWAISVCFCARRHAWKLNYIHNFPDVPARLIFHDSKIDCFARACKASAMENGLKARFSYVADGRRSIVYFSNRQTSSDEWQLGCSFTDK